MTSIKIPTAFALAAILIFMPLSAAAQTSTPMKELSIAPVQIVDSELAKELKLISDIQVKDNLKFVLDQDRVLILDETNKVVSEITTQLKNPVAVELQKRSSAQTTPVWILEKDGSVKMTLVDQVKKQFVETQQFVELKQVTANQYLQALDIAVVQKTGELLVLDNSENKLRLVKFSDDQNPETVKYVSNQLASQVVELKLNLTPISIEADEQRVVIAHQDGIVVIPADKLSKSVITETDVIRLQTQYKPINVVLTTEKIIVVEDRNVAELFTVDPITKSFVTKQAASERIQLENTVVAGKVSTTLTAPIVAVDVDERTGQLVVATTKGIAKYDITPVVATTPLTKVMTQVTIVPAVTEMCGITISDESRSVDYGIVQLNTESSEHKVVVRSNGEVPVELEVLASPWINEQNEVVMPADVTRIATKVLPSEQTVQSVQSVPFVEKTPLTVAPKVLDEIMPQEQLVAQLQLKASLDDPTKFGKATQQIEFIAVC